MFCQNKTEPFCHLHRQQQDQGTRKLSGASTFRIANPRQPKRPKPSEGSWTALKPVNDLKKKQQELPLRECWLCLEQSVFFYKCEQCGVKFCKGCKQHMGRCPQCRKVYNEKRCEEFRQVSLQERRQESEQLAIELVEFLGVELIE